MDLVGISFVECFDIQDAEATAQDLENYHPEEDEMWLDELRNLPY